MKRWDRTDFTTLTLPLTTETRLTFQGKRGRDSFDITRFLNN